MTRLIPYVALYGMFCSFAGIVSAQTAPLGDGPWIDLPAGYQIDTTPPTYDDIVTMADLDGDPSVISEEEQRMIDVLSLVLGSRPITD